MIEEKSNLKDKTGRISLIFSVIAIIAVIVFFVLEITENDESHEPAIGKSMPVISSESGSIVFVNTDMVLQNYELVTKLTTELESDRKRKDADFTSRQKAYESDAAYFQDQVQQQSISEASAQQIYEQLMMKQQELYELQDQLTAQLAQKEFEMNMVLLDSIRNYLERLNLTYKYDYILSYNSTGNILLGRDTFNITQQIIDGLNKEYFIKYKPEE